MQVLNTLKPGLDERIYENALVLELKAAGHMTEQQRHFPVVYREMNVGTLIPDLIVDGSVIVDPKVVSAFTETHAAQMMGSLAITGLHLAILVNFRMPSSNGSVSSGKTQNIPRPDCTALMDSPKFPSARSV